MKPPPVSVESVATPYGSYSAWVMNWHSWDGQNILKHRLQGPLFKPEDDLQRKASLIRFTDMASQALKDHPPVDKEKMDAERSKAKARELGISDA